MSYELQFLRERAPAAVTRFREHAVYADAQRSDRQIQKARDVAEVLARNHRPAPARSSAQLIDVKA